MVFSSLTFLCVFLPIVLTGYLLCPARWRNLLLAAVSLIFYAWGEPVYILIMLFSTVFDYANGRLLEYFDGQKNQRARKLVLAVSIAGNLGILFFFKYVDMFLSTVQQLTGNPVKLLSLTLPIGISFYTFQTMSYTIDVYKREITAQHSLIDFCMYVSLFPQLIAGPIVRYRQIEDEMENRCIVRSEWVAGMQRFLIGLGKKVLFANQIGQVWEEISGGSLNELTTAGAWLGAFAYTFQIYFDFSGYSDMAIGLGRMFGFSFPENFRYPYEAQSITDFWRRWHMTLGGWFREYVYIPLGGNRKGLLRQIINLFVVWFLTGLWHGASWNFVIWGLYYFVLLLLEKVFLLREMEHWHAIVRHLYSKLAIVVGWVIFAVEDFGDMKMYLSVLLGWRHALIDETAMYQWRTAFVLLLVLAVAATQLPKRLAKRAKRWLETTVFAGKETLAQTVFLTAAGVYTIAVLLVSLSLLISGSYNPFLYFRF